MTDPIIDEVRKTRDEHASRFDYNLEAIFRDIQERQKTSGRKYVKYPPRRIAQMSRKAAASDE